MTGVEGIISMAASARCKRDQTFGNKIESLISMKG